MPLRPEYVHRLMCLLWALGYLPTIYSNVYEIVVKTGCLPGEEVCREEPYVEIRCCVRAYEREWFVIIRGYLLQDRFEYSIEATELPWVLGVEVRNLDMVCRERYVECLRRFGLP